MGILWQNKRENIKKSILFTILFHKIDRDTLGGTYIGADIIEK